MTSNADVLRILRALRRRLHAALFLERLATSALIVCATLVIYGVLNRSLFGAPPLRAGLLAYAAAATCALAVIGTLAGRCSLVEVAGLLDARGQTRDRFVSALAFSEKPAGAGPMRELAEQECSAFLMRTDFRPLVPVRPPAIGAWLVVPLVALTMLQWEFALDAARRRSDAAEAQAKIANTVRVIEELAKQAERANEQTKNNDLQKLVEELKQSAERLHAETHGDDAQKSALRELSALEAAMKEMQRQPSPPAEMQELAKALAPVPGMMEVLNALNQNKLADAAKALGEAEKKADEKPDATTDEQVRQALKQATERLAQQRQLSDALQKLMDQARQQGAGQKSVTSQAMDQLRKMIQQMQKNGSDSQSGGDPQQQRTLQQLIAALQNMKFDDGRSQPQPGPPGGQPLNGPQIALQSPGARNSDGQPQPADGKEPTGHPGSEHDFGTTDTPFGAKNDRTGNGADTALKGRLGEGESLSMMLPAASDTSKVARRYQELYNAMAPAAENAIEQENIPLGSRFFIKRYFESIRPKE
jgi:hypothetical protein